MIRPSVVSIHLNEYLCHCSCAHSKAGTFKVNMFVHSCLGGTHKILPPLTGQLLFSLNVLLA